ncbi:MAG: Hsp70 family protein, partial [Cyanobacteria bacterium P01_F01_bin.3]
KQMEELKDKLEEADKTAVEGAIAALKEAVEKEDYDGMKAKTEELQQTLYGITSKMYQAAGGDVPPDGAAPGEAPGGEAPGGAPGGPADDDVIDAEFSESK